MSLIWILTPVALLIGLGSGYIIRKQVMAKQGQSLEAKTQQQIEEAKKKKEQILAEAEEEARRIKKESESELKEKEKHLQELEKSIRKKEENLDKRSLNLDDEKKEINEKRKKIKQIRKEIDEIKTDQQERLAKVAEMSKEKAKDVLLSQVEEEQEAEVLEMINRMEKEAKEEGEKKANKIIATVIGRLASEVTAESTVKTVSLPNEEMKGRIIGREGRNIQSFEKEAGVDLIVDDTPEAVVISCFDPVRREQARIALEKLVADGRIHPAKIEETLKKAKEEVEKEIKKAGEQAAYEVGVAGAHSDLIKILGRLKYRTSFGQNVLKHSTEVAHIASMLAGELDADEEIAKKAGLFHDIGKAIDHEVSGNHALISKDIGKKYGLSEEVIHAIAAHHEDEEPKTLEAIIIKAADAISGARPGARRETLDFYLKRLKDLESIADSYEGVNNSYAIQAGREIRMIVEPEEISDLQAKKLARKVADRIEKELDYPGQVKVNVVREKRAIEFAK
jgi:ribonuclease Y